MEDVACLSFVRSIMVQAGRFNRNPTTAECKHALMLVGAFFQCHVSGNEEIDKAKRGNKRILNVYASDACRLQGMWTRLSRRTECKVDEVKGCVLPIVTPDTAKGTQDDGSENSYSYSYSSSDES